MSERLTLIVIVLLLSFGCKSTLTEIDRKLIAASITNKEAVMLALDDGANVDAVDENGDGAIYNATSSGRLDIVKLLVENGASFQKPRKSMFRETSVLHIASQNGDLALIEFFLDNGMNINMTVDGETPLLKAVSSNRVDAVKYLIAKGADVNGNPKKAGMLPLHEAAKLGNLNMVWLLFNAGANIHINQGTYGTPLYQAVINGKIEIAKQLIDLGANVNASIDATYRHKRYFYDVTPYDMALFEIKWLQQFLVRQPNVSEEIKKYENLIEYIDFVGGKALAHERHEERIKEKARRRELWSNIGTTLGETLKATAIALNSSEFQNAVIQISHSASQEDAPTSNSNVTSTNNAGIRNENYNNQESQTATLEINQSVNQNSVSNPNRNPGQSFNGVAKTPSIGSHDTGLCEYLKGQSEIDHKAYLAEVNEKRETTDFSKIEEAREFDRFYAQKTEEYNAKVRRMCPGIESESSAAVQ